MTEETALTAGEAEMLNDNSETPVVHGTNPSPPADAEPASVAPLAQQPAEPPLAEEKTVKAAAADKTDWMDMLKNLKNRLADPKALSFAAVALALLLGMSQLFMLVKLSGVRKQVESLAQSLDETKTQLLAKDQEQEKRFSSDLLQKELHEKEARKQAVIIETLNRIRNGQPEARLRRRNEGDWRVADKAEAVVSVPEVIEYLNGEMKKAKSAKNAKLELPPHNEDPLCVLRPDGKGGTMISFVPDFIVGSKASK